MARKRDRVVVRLKSTKSGYCYYTSKKKVSGGDKIKLCKFDPTIRQHVEFIETSKSG